MAEQQTESKQGGPSVAAYIERLKKLDGAQLEKFDALVEKHLGWKKVIRNENFQRAWKGPSPWPLNNYAAAQDLEGMGVDWAGEIGFAA